MTAAETEAAQADADPEAEDEALPAAAQAVAPTLLVIVATAVCDSCPGGCGGVGITLLHRRLWF